MGLESAENGRLMRVSIQVQLFLTERNLKGPELGELWICLGGLGGYYGRISNSA